METEYGDPRGEAEKDEDWGWIEAWNEWKFPVENSIELRWEKAKVHKDEGSSKWKLMTSPRNWINGEERCVNKHLKHMSLVGEVKD